MHGGWQVLDLSTFSGSLNYRRGQLCVHPDDGDVVALPLEQLAVLLVNINTSISGAVLAKLGEYDIALFVCDWRSIPQVALYPLGSHSRIAARHIAQSELSLPRKKQAWSSIIKAKIRGQAATLKPYNACVTTLLESLANSVRSGDPQNCEAQAARRYWSALPLPPGFTRQPHTGADGVNACFDYAYTILRGHGIRALGAAGLAGPLGVFHRNRQNAYALVDDLIEPFRPAIDAYLIQNVATWSLDSKETKAVLVAASTQPFGDSGQQLQGVLVDFAQQFGLYVEGNSEKLAVPLWRGLADAS